MPYCEKSYLLIQVEKREYKSEGWCFITDQLIKPQLGAYLLWGKLGCQKIIWSRSFKIYNIYLYNSRGIYLFSPSFSNWKNVFLKIFQHYFYHFSHHLQSWRKGRLKNYEKCFHDVCKWWLYNDQMTLIFECCKT